MGINRRFAEAREKLAKETSSKMGSWESIMPRISQGVVIPIVSSSFRIEQIFRDGNEATGDEEGSSIFEELTAEWADLIGYPMSDKQNLARVAQYYLVEQKDNPHARTKYLDFLKTFLITIATNDSEYTDLARRLKSQIQEQCFSEIAHQLDYPRCPNGVENPLRLLRYRDGIPVYSWGRSGSGNGRAYRITFRARDNLGAESTGAVMVCVPHDQGENAVCHDDGQVHDSTAP